MTNEEKKYLKRYADIKLWLETLAKIADETENHLLEPVEGISLFNETGMYSMKSGIVEVAEIMEIPLECWLSSEGKYYYTLPYKTIRLLQTSREPLREQDIALRPVLV